VRHLAAADQIGGAFGEDDVPEVVAAHLVAAYEAAGDSEDAASVKARAGEMFVLAGERAERLAAAGEAQRFFEQAAALSDDRHASAALIDRAGRMAWVAGRPDEASSLLERARASFDEHGDVVAMALADAKLAEIEFTQGHPPLAAERLAPALEAIQRVGSPEEIAVLAAQLGRFLVFTREYDRAGPLLEQALVLAEKLDLPETYVQALNSKSTLLLYVDRPREARLLVRGALAAALEHELHEPALRAFNNVIAHAWSDEEFEAALEILDRALAYARRIGDRQWETSFLAGSCGSLEMLGRWDEALRRVDEAESHSPTGFVRGLMVWTAVIHVHRGEPELARAVLERNAEVASSENPEFACSYALLSAQLQSLEGDVEGAVEAVAHALGDFRREAATWLPFMGLEVAAETMDERLIRRLLSATDDAKVSRGTRAQQARLRARLPGHDTSAELSEAERLFRELDARFYISCIQLERAEHLLAAGRGDEAEPLLAEAREAFERLRATPWLARVDAAFGVVASAASA
jgi:tetratricopeptide (TPR) repeat protein